MQTAQKEEKQRKYAFFIFLQLTYVDNCIINNILFELYYIKLQILHMRLI